MVIFYFNVVYTYVNPILLNYLKQGDCLFRSSFKCCYAYKILI